MLFSDYEKEILTPVSAFEYYDTDSNWVSIDFEMEHAMNGKTKTWDIDVFPDYPSGERLFIIKIKYKNKICFIFSRDLSIKLFTS